MRVLGIETSCDETAVAVYDSAAGLLAHRLFSQAPLHAEYGGVVPELAARDHIRKLLPMIATVMTDAATTSAELDGVAYTAGPGLVGALMVGGAVGTGLAYAWGVPTVAVHHMEGHLLAPMLEDSPPEFPFVALLVSGGHTQLVRVEGIGDYAVLGESLDDAAGEAFDKVAKMLDLDYPGGPRVAQLAQTGDPARFVFPRPMTDRPGLDFSFSGLKTHVLNTITTARGDARWPDSQTIADIAAGFQLAVVETLVIKCRRALAQTGLASLVIAGGVAANRLLRERLRAALAEDGGRVFYARGEFCTDNAAMIAYAGCQRLQSGQDVDWGIRALPRWPLVELPPVVATPVRG